MRWIYDAELQLLGVSALLPNIARLREQTPGVSSPVAYLREGAAMPCAAIADGQTRTAATMPDTAIAVGVEWPIRHVVDKSTLLFAGAVGAPHSPVLETHNGVQWVPVLDEVTHKQLPDERAVRQ